MANVSPQTRDEQQYASISIYKISAEICALTTTSGGETPAGGDSSKSYSPYFVLSAKDKKYQSITKEKTRTASWENESFSIVFQDHKDIKGSLKLSLWSKEKLKKDKFLGEVNIELSQLILCPHNQMPTLSPSALEVTQQKLISEYSLEFLIKKEKKKPKATVVNDKEKDEIETTDGPAEETTETQPVVIHKVKLFAEVTGWKVILDTLQNPKTISQALFNIGSLAEAKGEKKYKQYIRKDIIKKIKKLALTPETTLEVKEKIAIALCKMVKRDDESLHLFERNRGLSCLAKLASKSKESKFLVIILECFKPFFKFAEHQSVMLKCGILTRLGKLIFDENVQIQTRALAVIQYLDAVHQEELIKKGIIADLMKLLTRESPPLQHKTLSVLQHFDRKYHEQMIREGLLSHLVALMSNGNIHLRIKAFEVAQDFVEAHQEDLIKEGILGRLIEFLNHEDKQIRSKALDIVARFDASQTLRFGFLRYLMGLIAGSDEQLQSKAFQILLGIDRSHHDAMVAEGILSQLIELIATEDPPEPQTQLLNLHSIKINAIPPAPPTSKKIPKKKARMVAPTPASHRTKRSYETGDLPFDAQWSCSACTYLNPYGETRCQICDTPKPPTPIIIPSTTSPSLEPDYLPTYPDDLTKEELELLTQLDAFNSKGSKGKEEIVETPQSKEEEKKTPKSSNVEDTYASRISDEFNKLNEVLDKLGNFQELGIQLPPLEPPDVANPPPLPPRDDEVSSNPTSNNNELVTDTQSKKANEGTAVTFSPSVEDHVSADPRMAERKMSIASEMSTEVDTVETEPTDDEKEREVSATDPSEVTLTLNPVDEVKETNQLTPENTSKVQTDGKLKETKQVATTSDTPKVITDDTTKVTPKEESKLPWSCSICTFSNQETATQCEMCENVRQTGESILSDIREFAMPTPMLSSATQTSAFTVNMESQSPTLSSSATIKSEPSQTVVPAISEKKEIELEIKIEIPKEKKKLTAQQLKKVLEVLRHFHVKYQADMVKQGIIRYLQNLFENTAVENDVIMTIAYFDESYHPQMIEQGLFKKFFEKINAKNAKVFLVLIEGFQYYQKEVMSKDLLNPIISLLSVDDVHVQSRICDFILNFDETYRKAIIQQVKTVTGVDSKDKEEEVPSTILIPPPPPLGPKDACKQCGGIGGHLTNCIYFKKNGKGKPIVKAVPQVNYTLISQSKKLIWQLENQGLRLLRYRILFNDGGESSKKYKALNIMTPNSTVYCSSNPLPVNIVLEYEGTGIPWITHVIIKAPRMKFDSPIKTAAIFASATPPDIRATFSFNKLTANDFEKLSGEVDKSMSLVAFLHVDNFYCEVALKKPTLARFILIKFLTATKKTVDVEYVGFVGIAASPNSDSKSNTKEMTIPTLDLLEDIGNRLGVKKRVKRFDFNFDFDTSGLLYWIGTDEGQHSWLNPVTGGQVVLTTSHAMYSVGMKLEDIISREGGTSCYWGSTCPQYFILDLRHRRLRCNYFTLRHGYQAANSYIQNWTFCGSNDSVNWTTLFEGGETPFAKAFDVRSWSVPDGKDYFRYFRVLQKGNYSMGKGMASSGSAYLCIAGFELYGEMLLD